MQFAEITICKIINVFFGKFSCGMGLLYMVNPPEKGKNKLNSQTAKGRSFHHTWRMQILSQS